MSVSYPFGFLDEYAKKEIRRSTLKAVAIPGYQVPYSSREMPMGRGFGTGGLQLTLALIGKGDTLKVIDQGSDDSVNAVNLRSFIEMTCPGIYTTTKTEAADIIQSRHRIPEKSLREDQLLVLQVPYPDPLVVVEASEDKRKMLHGEADYSRLLVKLYEDIVKFDEITISHRYPTRINNHYVIDPSPIPRWDVPKIHLSKVLILFGAGREKKIYAVPPYTKAEPLAFDDVPFRVEEFYDKNGQRRACQQCGCTNSFLDEFVDSKTGEKVYQCSDTDWCDEQGSSSAAGGRMPGATDEQEARVPRAHGCAGAADEQVRSNVAEATTPGTEEIEQRMEQLPTTPGTEEVEQRMEQLPRTPEASEEQTSVNLKHNGPEVANG